MGGASVRADAAGSGLRLVSTISGAAILVDAVAARLMLSADSARVYILGHPIAWQCALRRAGLPCPTCGLTRSVVMTLAGHLAGAWNIAPGGPVLAAGGLMAALALLSAAFRRGPWPRWMRTGGLVYAAAAMAIWLGGWALQFARAWRVG